MVNAQGCQQVICPVNNHDICHVSDIFAQVFFKMDFSYLCRYFSTLPESFVKWNEICLMFAYY